VSGCDQSPDVFGFLGGDVTVLIEVKTSKQDFKADFKKRYRKLNRNIGNYRYYFCPPDVIKETDLPEKWGLIYCNENNEITVVRMSESFTDKDRHSEMLIMYSVIRRLAGIPKVLNFKKNREIILKLA
jgi:hypothetical protein